jgi:hypothetical protein
MTSALKQAADEFLVRYGGDVFPNLFTSAKGTIVTDSDGRDYLDFTSGQMCATIGHNHPAIVAAVESAGKKAFHLFSGMIPEVVAELGDITDRDTLEIYLMTVKEPLIQFEDELPFLWEGDGQDFAGLAAEIQKAWRRVTAEW